MKEPGENRRFCREQIRAWIEEATGEGLSVDDPLPDTLAATAEALGMHPAELRLWVYDQPKPAWTSTALANWARRHGFTRDHAA